MHFKMNLEEFSIKDALQSYSIVEPPGNVRPWWFDTSADARFKTSLSKSKLLLTLHLKVDTLSFEE